MYNGQVEANAQTVGSRSLLLVFLDSFVIGWSFYNIKAFSSYCLTMNLNTSASHRIQNASSDPLKYQDYMHFDNLEPHTVWYYKSTKMWEGI